MTSAIKILHLKIFYLRSLLKKYAKLKGIKEKKSGMITLFYSRRVMSVLRVQGFHARTVYSNVMVKSTFWVIVVYTIYSLCLLPPIPRFSSQVEKYAGWHRQSTDCMVQIRDLQLPKNVLLSSRRSISDYFFMEWRERDMNY